MARRSLVLLSRLVVVPALNEGNTAHAIESFNTAVQHRLASQLGLATWALAVGSLLLGAVIVGLVAWRRKARRGSPAVACVPAPHLDQ